MLIRNPLHRYTAPLRQRIHTLRWVWGHRQDLSWLTSRLLDEESRRTVRRLVVSRVLGTQHVELGLGVRAIEALNEYAATLVTDRNTKTLDFRNWSTNRYDLAALGFDMRLDVHPENILHTFLLQQYDTFCFPEANVHSGDVVIDGGGCYGDTALWFAERVGPAGRVLTFEVDENNLAVLTANCIQNPDLARVVEIRKEALWRETGQLLGFAANGPAGHICRAPRDGRVKSRSIDSLVTDGVVPRVDFIKLDVEGAESEVLEGAAETIRRDKPRIAVAIYHKLNDIFELPQQIVRIAGDDYQLAITHRWSESEETMLFAWPRLLE